MKDALGDRMKSFYEDRYRIYLTRRMPVIIRVDGNAFHTFTKGLKRPFDPVFMGIMQKTCADLCKNIQGCVGGYVQSDEISLLLIDYNTITTDAWFDYNLQKVCSLAAARATMTFNQLVSEAVEELRSDAAWCHETGEGDEQECLKFHDIWKAKQNRAMFDARAFNIPKEEVCNYFIWRQKDATRNSINAVAQSLYSHKELQGKNLAETQELIFQKGINWNNYSIPEKRGSFIWKVEDTETAENGMTITKRGWIIDTEIPIFTEDRDYIDNLVFVGE